MSDFEFTITETSSMVDLEEYLNYLIVERSNEIYYKIISHDKEYQNLQAEIKSCFEEIRKREASLLPETVQEESVSERLSEIIGTLEMLLSKLVYRRVLKDGVRLKRWIEEE